MYEGGGCFCLPEEKRKEYPMPGEAILLLLLAVVVFAVVSALLRPLTRHRLLPLVSLLIRVRDEEAVAERHTSTQT